MTPTPGDLRDGVENSRRLARNAVRLGVDTENHREVSILLVIPLRRYLTLSFVSYCLELFLSYLT